MIDLCDEGEGVLPATVDGYVTAIGHAITEFNRLSLDPADHLPMVHLSSSVKTQAKRLHKLYSGGDVTRKLGFTADHARTIAAIEPTCWKDDHYKLMFLVLLHCIIRSIAGNHLRWIGDHVTLIAQPDSDISWSTHDVALEDGGLGVISKHTIRVDKTQHGKLATHRFVPANLIDGIDIASHEQHYIRKYKLPSGFYLFSPKDRSGNFVNTPFTNWQAFILWICTHLKLDPKLYGTHSCRRGMSEYLTSLDIPREELQYLGFWLSDSVMLYEGPKFARSIRIFGDAMRRRQEKEVLQQANKAKRRSISSIRPLAPAPVILHPPAPSLPLLPPTSMAPLSAPALPPPSPPPALPPLQAHTPLDQAMYVWAAMQWSAFLNGSAPT